MVIDNEKNIEPSRDIFMWIIKIWLKLKNHIQGIYKKLKTNEKLCFLYFSSELLRIKEDFKQHVIGAVRIH